jgi:transcriptional regulator with XRE-family HTH domain
MKLDPAVASSSQHSGLDLGARLKAVRQARGISQRELARRADVTNGAISLIEQNKSSPSVASLKKLLDSLSMSLAEFFSLEQPPQDQVFFEEHELLVLTDDNITFRQVGGNLDGRTLQILHERYAPGADTGKAMLRHDAEEGGIVIRGQVEVTVGEQRRILGPGDAYHFDSRLPHRFRNLGEEPCEIISACTPPYL